MTAPTRPLPPHGTLSRHKHYKCKCQACRENYRAYQRSRYRRKGYGTWQPFVDAEPVRQHLIALRDAGISYHQVAEIAGLHAPTVGNFLYPHAGQAPKDRARPETAAKILAVKTTDATPFRVDATGTRRRLQALAANGWPMKSLGSHIGVNPATVARLLNQRRVYSATAIAVADCYRKLHGQRPEDHGVPAGIALKARNHASREGWPGPGYWDDEDFDNPGFQPATGDVPRYVAIGENALELVDQQGYSRADAADRLGVTRDYLNASISRYRKYEAAA